jgi:hypothetical protein
MTNKRCYITPLLAAVAATVIATAPTAAADAAATPPLPFTTSLNGTTGIWETQYRHIRTLDPCKHWVIRATANRGVHKSHHCVV